MILMKKLIIITSVAITALFNAAHAQTLKEAIRLTENEQFEKASVAFKTLVQTEPQNGDNYYYFGKNYYKADKLDSARIWFEKGTQVAPNSPLNFVGLGRLSLDAGNKDVAKTNFDKAVTLSASKNATVFLEIAEAYLNTGKKDVTEAFNNINKAMKLAVNNPEVYILMGDAYLEKGDGSNAIKNYEKAVDLDKTSAKALLRIGKLYKNARNYNLALDYYKQAEKIDPNFAPTYSEQGELYYMAKQYDVAKEKYKKFLELSSSNLNARIRYASFLFLSKNYNEAINEINEIKKQDTTNVILNRLLARSYYETGKTKEEFQTGLRYLEKFFANVNPSKIIPSDYEFHGKLLAKMGQDSLAVLKYNQALAMDSTQTELYDEIANSYLKQKKYPDAIAFYQKKISSAKNVNANDYFGLGRAYYFSKDFVMADSAFAQIVRVQPNLPIGYFWRARANSSLDPDSKQGLARPYYETFIEKVGTDTEKNKKDLLEAYQYLGAYYYEKDKAKAKDYWTKVQEIDPKNEKAKRALEALK